MASWPQNPRLIGTRIPRIDGLLKASGKMKYPSDMRPEGTLFGVVLYSPHAHAKIKSIDTSAAEKMPGVKGVIAIAKAGSTMRYQGDDIAAVAAETEEQARDAARAIKVEYEVLPHCVTEEQSMAPGAPKVAGARNVVPGRSQTTGKPSEAVAAADVVVEGTYSVPTITHVCLETHGMTVKYESDDKVTAWASTQNVAGVAGELAQILGVKSSAVTVLTEAMGGGFGSKFGADVWGRAAALLSKQTGRPVKVFLDRIQEHLAAGNRPSASARVTLAATQDGKVTALVAEAHGTPGSGGGTDVILPYVYTVPNIQVKQNSVLTNTGSQRAMRAPRHPQSCLITEGAMDDLAAKLGMDPIEFRLKNLNQRDFHTPIYEAELAMGAALIGWRENWKPRGQNGKGPIKRGLGVALHQWGGGGANDKQVTCKINPDGSVELQSATQDLGTGIRTVLAIIAAEILGLKVSDITSNIGNSKYVLGQASGGSTTTPSMSPPCYMAVTQARDALLKKIAPGLNTTPENLSLKDGSLWMNGEPTISWKDACRKLGTMPIVEVGKFEEGLSGVGVGGCQFADVTVDIETGVVRAKKLVAIQDSGLIIDKLTWESQVYGGVIGGLNYGLFEEQIMDPVTGVMLNADMELYKLAGASDIPEIIVKAYEPDSQKARGVIGVGEPPTIATAAAIGNAVSNAIGVRVSQWPMTPRNVLNALNKEGKA